MLGGLIVMSPPPAPFVLNNPFAPPPSHPNYTGVRWSTPTKDHFSMILAIGRVTLLVVSCDAETQKPTVNLKIVNNSKAQLGGGSVTKKNPGVNSVNNMEAGHRYRAAFGLLLAILVVGATALAIHLRLKNAVSEAL